jgi:fructose-1,6-bisphosphatase
LKETKTSSADDRIDDTFIDREFVIGETFEEWLDKGNVDKALRKVLTSLTEIAFKEISLKIKEASTNKQGTVNEFGDEQLAIDVLADKVMFKAL